VHSGELVKLGITLSKRTIQKYLPKDKKPFTSSQFWATFLKNQADNMRACHFNGVYDWLFRPWYVFVITELKPVGLCIPPSPTPQAMYGPHNNYEKQRRGPRHRSI
jgi:hypothetical protein